MARCVSPLSVEPSKPAPPRPSPPQGKPSLARWIVPLALVGYTAWSFVGMRAPKAPSISYSEFYAFVEQGKVASVTLAGQQATGKLKQEDTVGGKKVTEFQTVLAQQDDRDLLPLLRAQHVNVDVNSEHTSLLEQAALSFLPWVLILGGWFWISRRMQSAGGASLPFGGVAARTRRVAREDGPRASGVSAASFRGGCFS
jgi:cell division protease FtsH